MLENCRRSCGSCLSPQELRQMCMRRSGNGPMNRRPMPPPMLGIEGPAPWDPRRRPPPPLPIPEFDFASGINVPGLFSLRWGRDAKNVNKNKKTM